MNSEEALTELFNEANRFSREEPKFTTYDLWEMYNQIEKDSEVLEILKHLINGLEETFNQEGISSDTTILGTIIKDYFINNDITGKVKEWLNDK